MQKTGSTSVIVYNCLFVVLLLMFFAGVFYDVRIEMSSLSVMTTGLIVFPIAFVVINMGALNRKYPLGGKHRGQETAQASVDRDYPDNR